MPTFFGVAQLSPTDLNAKHSSMMMLSSVPTLSIRTTSHKLKHSHSQTHVTPRAFRFSLSLSLSGSPDGDARSLSFRERAFLRCFGSSSFWAGARAHAEFFTVVNLLARFQVSFVRSLSLSFSLVQVSPAETLGLPLFFRNTASARGPVGSQKAESPIRLDRARAEERKSFSSPRPSSGLCFLRELRALSSV